MYLEVGARVFVGGPVDVAIGKITKIIGNIVTVEGKTASHSDWLFMFSKTDLENKFKEDYDFFDATNIESL